MKKRFLRYAGDKAVGALLECYTCPTSFHVVRTRFLGNIATPKLDASPLRTIESFWEGELPVSVYRRVNTACSATRRQMVAEPGDWIEAYIIGARK